MKRIAALIAVFAAAALAQGCSTLSNGAADAKSIAEEHPIAVDTQVVTLAISVDDAAAGLSTTDRARVRAFADAYLRNGHGPVSVTAPTGSRGDRAAADAAAEARAVLDETGVDAADIEASAYRSAEDKRELVLSFTRYVATPSACGDWSSTYKRDFKNLSSPNYGCATQNNLAAMIADPRDLTQPADETPADAAARVRMIGAYRRGEKTASETDGDIKAEVSQ
jgi:pilus assembly protein CpaD